MFGLKGGTVSVPRWILIFRAFQFIFAVLVIALTAYALSINHGGPLRTPLIALLVIAVLTILPILVLVTPLHLIQRKHFDPRIALLLDGFALLYWTAAFAALASYEDIFQYYGRDTEFVDFVFDGCQKCRSAWRSGIAATVFAALEVLLFLFTTLAFIFYYHHHIAGTHAPGLGHRSHGTGTAATTGTTGTRATGTAAGGAAAEEHQMSLLNSQSNTHGTGNHGIPAPPASGGYGSGTTETSGGHMSPTTGGFGKGPGVMSGGNVQPTSGAGGHQPPYPESPTRPARTGG